MTTPNINFLRAAQQLESVAKLPPSLQSLVSEIIQQPQFKAYFSPAQVSTLLAIEPDCELLLRHLLPLAQSYSFCPISKFKVGAVALADNGSIFLGANIEFAQQTLGQTVHAEQAVISNAWHHGATYLTHLAVTATPCGHCRQFINELEGAKKLRILLPEQDAITFPAFLPHSFGPDDLAVNDRLMNSKPNQIAYQTDEPQLVTAIENAKASYSPYSNSPSGIVISTKNSQYSGRYAENCAYNPSLSPLQSALIALHLAGEQFSEIKTAILVESKSAPVSQYQQSVQLLKTLVDIELLHYQY
ncbi:cytidine deaminase [Alteromonadales bacterium alter-6D02]|nr:cytidine deaminase [Alteromonadales bacterium alter-6D02]